MDPNWSYLLACRAAAKPSVRLTPATIMYADNNSSNLGIMRSAQYLHQVWSLTLLCSLISTQKRWDYKTLDAILVIFVVLSNPPPLPD